VAAAFGWGTLAGSSLVIGAIVALRFRIGLRAIGLTIYEGGAIGAAYLAAVFLSNLPEAIASTSGLASGGWEKSRILWMWVAIALIAGIASLAGYALFQDSPPDTVAFSLAFAAGAILTMLAQTMMPEACEHGGTLVGVVTRSDSRSRSPSTRSIDHRRSHGRQTRISGEELEQERFDDLVQRLDGLEQALSRLVKQ
jgi:hypothetical protein